MMGDLLECETLAEATKASTRLGKGRVSSTWGRMEMMQVSGKDLDPLSSKEGVRMEMVMLWVCLGSTDTHTVAGGAIHRWLGPFPARPGAAEGGLGQQAGGLLGRKSSLELSGVV